MIIHNKHTIQNHSCDNCHVMKKKAKIQDGFKEFKIADTFHENFWNSIIYISKQAYFSRHAPKV